MTYTTQEALATTRYVELVGKKEFVTTALDLEHEIFVDHIVSFGSTTSLSFTPFNVVHLSYKPQIASLIAEEVFTKVLNKYNNFADIFFPDLAF